MSGNRLISKFGLHIEEFVTIILTFKLMDGTKTNDLVIKIHAYKIKFYYLELELNYREI